MLYKNAIARKVLYIMPENRIRRCASLIGCVLYCLSQWLWGQNEIEGGEVLLKSALQISFVFLLDVGHQRETCWCLSGTLTKSANIH